MAGILWTRGSEGGHVGKMTCTVSIVVPTLNEAGRIAALVGGLIRQDRGCEVIVVDGGSEDGTCEIAETAGARVLNAEVRGRGQQLKLGADQAQADVLLFLHADTRFPDGGLAAMRDRLSDPEIVGGNFRVLFDGDDAFSKWLNGFYAWFRKHGLYYGDSAVFVRRSVYWKLGGIQPLAVMEDYDFTRRLERYGRTTCIDDLAVVTSSRRFVGQHPVAIFNRWLVLHALFHIGVPATYLARLYNSERLQRRRSRTASRY